MHIEPSDRSQNIERAENKDESENIDSIKPENNLKKNENKNEIATKSKREIFVKSFLGVLKNAFLAPEKLFTLDRNAGITAKGLTKGQRAAIFAGKSLTAIPLLAVGLGTMLVYSASLAKCFSKKEIEEKQEGENLIPLQTVSNEIKNVDIEDLKKQIKEKAFHCNEQGYHFSNGIILSENDIQSIAQQAATIQKTEHVRHLTLDVGKFSIKLKNIDTQGKTSHKISLYKHDIQLGQGYFGSVTKLIKVGKEEKVFASKEIPIDKEGSLDECWNLIYLRMTPAQRKEFTPQEFIKTPEGKKIAKTVIKGIMDAPRVVNDNRTDPVLDDKKCGYIGKCYDGNAEKLFDPENKNTDHKNFFTGMLDVLEGIEYLHNNDMVHGDIKSDNVFCKKEGETFNFYLGDFGGCRTKEKLKEKHERNDNYINHPDSYLQNIFALTLESIPFEEQQKMAFNLCKNLDVHCFLLAIYKYGEKCSDEKIQKKFGIKLSKLIYLDGDDLKNALIGKGSISISELKNLLKTLIQISGKK